MLGRIKDFAIQRACCNASGARKETLALFSEPRKIKTQLQKFFLVVSLMQPFQSCLAELHYFVLKEPMCDYQTCRRKLFHVLSGKHLARFAEHGNMRPSSGHK